MDIVSYLMMMIYVIVLLFLNSLGQYYYQAAKQNSEAANRKAAKTDISYLTKRPGDKIKGFFYLSKRPLKGLLPN